MTLEQLALRIKRRIDKLDDQIEYLTTENRHSEIQVIQNHQDELRYFVRILEEALSKDSVE